MNLQGLREARSLDRKYDFPDVLAAFESLVGLLSLAQGENGINYRPYWIFGRKKRPYFLQEAPGNFAFLFGRTIAHG